MSGSRVIGSPARTLSSRRSKITVPKPPAVISPPPRSKLRHNTTEEGEGEVEGEEKRRVGVGFQLAFDLDDIDQTPGQQEPHLNDSEIPEDILLHSSENYRRFGSRVRRKTKFYTHLEDESNGAEGSADRGKRKRAKVASVVRKLQFEPQQPKIPLVAAPPDVPQALVGEKSCEGRQGEGEAREDVIVKVEKEICSNGKPSKDAASPPAPHVDSGPTLPAMSTSAVTSGRDDYPVGSIVWGKLPGYDWWPGIIISYCRDKEGDAAGRGEGGGGGGGGEGGARYVWVKWYGENNLSQIHLDKVALLSHFSAYFTAHNLKGIYRKGIFMAIKEAARRCKMEFISRSEDKTAKWIITDSSLEPTPIGGEKEGEVMGEGEREGEGCEEGDGGLEEEDREKAPGKNEKGVSKPSENKAGGKRRRRRRAGRGDKGGILLNSLEQEMLHWAQHGFLPAGPEGLTPTAEQSVTVQVVPVNGGGKGEEGRRGKEEGGEEEEPPKKKAKVMLLQVRKKAHFESVMEGKMNMSDLCIACGDIDVVADHPLFQGRLCKECKDTFLECTYLFDDDGTQMYCCICSAGEEVFMCDAENCAKVYCHPCIEKLCGDSELERVKAAERWLCYMCCPQFHTVGLLARRQNWDRKLQELFLNDHEMEYESPPTYPPISPECRKPMRVLGLFDGIGTGLLVLKELGIEVETYVASEIDPDAIKVSRGPDTEVSLVWHHEMRHCGDIGKITESKIQQLGPFDLVIGGSPCNDLSIVNPARKGIYGGTGRLFFEFFRILSYVRLVGRGEQPLFWLYENVVSMRAQDKQTISRFLQCNPVVVDAKDISATHRARYFWGNIPGMNRAITPLPGDRLTLQDCLEPNCSRVAQFTKLRTITTKMNSIKQTKAAIYPVRMGQLVGGMEQQPGSKEEEGEGDHKQGDVLWCTEMERLFGFPDHYTDVANLGRCGRQRLLGKSWSVPVLRHLLSPLKDYFRSNTTRDRKTAT